MIDIDTEKVRQEYIDPLIKLHKANHTIYGVFEVFGDLQNSQNVREQQEGMEWCLGSIEDAVRYKGYQYRRIIEQSFPTADYNHFFNKIWSNKICRPNRIYGPGAVFYTDIPFNVEYCQIVPITNLLKIDRNPVRKQDQYVIIEG
jgi:hypothetical protein